jgi:hypothetical protein
MSIRLCGLPECERKHKGHDLCGMHLSRLKRTGTTDDPPRLTFEERFWAKVDVRGPDECWPWTSALNEHGYGVIRPEGQRSGPGLKAHRVAAEMAGMDVEGWHVLHSCDNPPCVNAAHLRPGTPADNAADRVDRNRNPRGSTTGTAKLTEQQALEIRRRRRAGEGRNDIAAEFSVSGSTVTRIASGQGWTHLPEDSQAAVTPLAARDLIAAMAESTTGEAIRVAA